MNRDEAFKYIRSIIETPEPNSGDYADRQRFAADKKAYEVKMKGAVVGAIIILEDALNDFKRVASALEGIAQKSNITYAGPRKFQVVDNVATTVDDDQ